VINTIGRLIIGLENNPMLDDKDIQKLIEVFATREEIVTKLELEGLRQEFVNLPSYAESHACVP